MRNCIVAGILLFDGNGEKVLLVKHRKLGVWIYPGGHMEADENPVECAIRETKEETGINAEILSLLPFQISEGETRSTPYPLIIMDEIVPYMEGPHRHFDILYIGISKEDKIRINSESEDIKWFSKQEIKDLDTFENVKSIITYGFESIGRLIKRVNKDFGE